jgi:hypothetical protein
MSIDVRRYERTERLGDEAAVVAFLKRGLWLIFIEWLAVATAWSFAPFGFAQANGLIVTPLQSDLGDRREHGRAGGIRSRRRARIVSSRHSARHIQDRVKWAGVESRMHEKDAGDVQRFPDCVRANLAQHLRLRTSQTGG